MPVNRKLFFACIATFLVWIAPGPARGLAAENIKNVALFPFDVYSTSVERAAELQETIYRGIAAELQTLKSLRLVSRDEIKAATEGKRLNDALIIEVGKKAGATYAVWG